MVSEVCDMVTISQQKFAELLERARQKAQQRDRVTAEIPLHEVAGVLPAPMPPDVISKSKLTLVAPSKQLPSGANREGILNQVGVESNTIVNPARRFETIEVDSSNIVDHKSLTFQQMKEIDHTITDAAIRSHDTAIQEVANEFGAPDAAIPQLNQVSIQLSTETHADSYGNSIIYNKEQDTFVNLATKQDDCILIGAAGTGKTTCMRGVVANLIHSSLTGVMSGHDHSHLPQDVPGVVVVAYTRRATNNIRRNMDEGMKGNCITIHKLLEYAPVWYDVENSEGEATRTMRFEPTRGPWNPLPATITTIIIEESSMVAVELFTQITDSCAHKVQFIFLGDIQQLPPVFGSAILGYKMLEWPVVELTQVYRQALESPIIRLAHRILSGEVIPSIEFSSLNREGELKITPWKKKISADAAYEISTQLFTKLHAAGGYNPETDIILLPFNKAYGTLELNRFIGNMLARKRGAITWEVVSGFQKHYFSIGDEVLYDREDATILDIYTNSKYMGALPQGESVHLDYWGVKTAKDNGAPHHIDDKEVDIDFLLAQAAGDEDRVTVASHCIKLFMHDSETEKVIDKAAEVNALLLGYCLTVHKSQGSEWEKVFLLLHNSHATMLQRELLYTAVTRAKKELFVICEQDTFIKGIQSQRIKGNTLAEKAEHFKGKIDRKEIQS